MITSVEFTNYRAFQHVKATFEPFTVVVGVNASGKTSLLRGIEDLVAGKAHRQPSWDQVRHLGQIGLVVLSCRFEATMGLPGSGVYHKVDATFTVSSDELIRRIMNPGEDPESRWARFLPDGRYLSLQPPAISQPSDVKAGARIRNDGAGLGAWLVDAFGRGPDRVSALQENVKKVIPSIEGITFGVYPTGGVGLFFSVNGNADIPADRMSEGTLLTVALLATILDSDGPFVLLLDDIERGLHPRAQRELISVIRSIQQSKPDLQIIATTHSPYLLGELDPKEVRLLSRAADGETLCRRLDEHPEFERWKGAFDAGQLWSFFGEDWEAEAPKEQPAA